jgi:DnaJ-class molecular chaperone
MNNPENMQDIFKMAQEVAKNINVPRNSDGSLDQSQVDMGKIFQEVSKSVSKMVTPDMVQQISSSMGQPSSPPLNRRKKHSKITVVSEDDDELEPAEDTLQKTKDLHFTLNVNLKHLYTGKTKNIAVKRQRFQTVDGKSVLAEDRKVLAVQIKPGMQDEEVIIFEGEGDEKKGYVPGDVIITLCYEEHPVYTRMNDDLFMSHTISLSECYDLDFTFKHISSDIIGVRYSGHNIMRNSNLYKLEGYGMPKLDEEGYGNLYIKFECDIPDELTETQVAALKELIPPISTKEETDKYPDLVEVLDDELESFAIYEDEDDEDDDEDDDDY